MTVPFHVRIPWGLLWNPASFPRTRGVYGFCDPGPAYQPRKAKPKRSTIRWRHAPRSSKRDRRR